MARVTAPNGDTYDLPATVASGLVGGAGGEWKYADEPDDTTQEGSGAENPQKAVEAPAGNASREEWAAYAATLGVETTELKQGQIREAVAAHLAANNQ